MRSFLRNLYRRHFQSRLRWQFHKELIAKTDNFSRVHWLGTPLWQNVLDLWTIQETLAEVKPRLLIECGTYRGGSSLFFAQCFDLMNHGEIITIDVEKQHSLSHPRITYLLGSSTAAEVLDPVKSRIAAVGGPVMVILDSDHTEAHVRRELDCFTPLVTPGSYCLVQDGVVDTQPLFEEYRPGPLRAIESFLKTTTDFELDVDRCERFLISHHPNGWLRRKK